MVGYKAVLYCMVIELAMGMGIEWPGVGREWLRLGRNDRTWKDDDGRYVSSCGSRVEWYRTGIGIRKDSDQQESSAWSTKSRAGTGGPQKRHPCHTWRVCW